jgi:hypothetical protein
MRGVGVPVLASFAIKVLGFAPPQQLARIGQELRNLQSDAMARGEGSPK